jgi:uridine kinase
MQTKIIGVSGGKCSGKSTLCKKICEELKGVEISFLSLDSFKKLESGPFVDFQDNSLNHHHPDLINFKLLHTTLLDLVSGKDVIINDFDYKTRSLVGKKTVKSTKVILIEGDLILYKKDIRDLLSLKIFIDLDSDQRLQRLVVHEVEENRRQLEDVLEEYHRFIKPCFDRHISNVNLF